MKLKLLKIILPIVLLILVVLGGYLLFFQGSSKKKVMVYSGCGIVKKAFMAEIAKAYRLKTGIRIELHGGGDLKGIRRVSDGLSDIGGGCRHPINNIKEKNTKPFIVAWGALVAIVNKKNPVKNISIKNLYKVLVGEITSWKKLGWKKGPKIMVLSRKSAYSGVGRMVRELLFKDLFKSYTPLSLIYSSTDPLERSLSSIPNGIAVSGDASARKRNVRMLSINGVYPTYENISSGNYPLFEPLYMFLGPKSGKMEKDFIKFILSEQGQNIIRSQGTVTVSDARAGGLYNKYRHKMSAMGIKNWK